MKFIFQIILLFIALTAFGQTTYQMGQQGVIVTCSGLFQDSGGDSQPYRANESAMMVICADGSQGTHTRLTFSDTDLPRGDVLCFYDGADVSAPLLSCTSDFFSGNPFIIQATAANNSGCVTVTFNSNGSEQGNGWNALIDCIPACQLIQVELERTTPSAMPLDTGWIDICLGDEVFFEGRGLFPQDGLIYNHSEATSTFEWDFGDGTSADGTSVSHVYNESGGYRVELTVTDQFGCRSSNFITQRVRVSTKPIFAITDDFPGEVCLGDTINLQGGVAGTTSMANITVDATEGAFRTKGFRSDSLALPDGNGRSYETSISFTDYRPGAILTRLSDLQSICLNMEHSWLHDMEIILTCPNGRKAKLQEQVLINDEVFLGEPVDNDGINPIPGIGKDYCWSPSATLGTMTEFANRNNDSRIGEPYFLPEGTFNPHESLTRLIGCPLNGEWTLTVTDLWEQDNGWVFSWGITFNPELIPTLEVYEPAIVNLQWADDPTIIAQSPANQPTNITVVPNTPGSKSYTFETTDEYGCRNDTTIQVNVLPPLHEDCLNCEDKLFAYNEITVCEGTEVNLCAYIEPSVLDARSFSKQENVEFGESTGEATIASSIAVSGVTPSTIGSNVEELLSVCVDLETDFAADITLFLRAPSGNVIRLSAENGGDATNFSQTCFSPKATIPIENGAGPFSSVFLPDDDFSIFTGENINGEWTLIAAAASNPDRLHTLKNWSIHFKGTTIGTFVWSPGTNISSTIGINPILKAEANTAPFYILEKEEGGCSVTDTIFINVLPSEVPLDVDYYNFSDGEVLFYWTEVANAIGYEISEDGVNWRPTDDRNFHKEVGFQNGDSRTFQFRAILSSQNCQTEPTTLVVNYLFCDLEATLLTRNVSVQCVGNDDATIEVRATGGNPPYRYVLNNSLEQVNGTFNNLRTGTYQVLVYDSDGLCADSLVFQVRSPEPIGIDFNIIHPSCHDLSDGAITAAPFGGIGGFSNFTWQSISETTPDLSELTAGNYILSVQDANGCTFSDTARVIAPLPLELTATQVPVSCFGGNDGEAGVKVTGGTPLIEDNIPIYTYIWNNDQSAADAVGLSIGQYQVTVTDNNGCSEAISTEVTQPEPITIEFMATLASCADSLDATVVAEASGGIEPYAYRWENGQTNQLNFDLSAGNYFVTVTDAQGCEEIANQVIDSTLALLIIPTFTVPLCPGSPTGSIDIVVAGGNMPYTYVWSDESSQTTATANNLTAGNYTVTVQDANGCESIETFELMDAETITITSNTATTSCPDVADGTGEIIATDGAMPYTYRWENGHQEAIQTDLAQGTYPITVTDANNCSVFDTILIMAPPALTLDSLVRMMPSCQGDSNGSILAMIEGGTAPYNYTWENDIQQNPLVGISSGFYDLLVTDANGCELSIPNIQLEEPNLLTVTTEIKDVLCFGEDTGEASAIPSGGTPPYRYRWSDGKNQNDSIATDLVEGSYMVTVEDQNGCQEMAIANIAQPETALSLSVNQTILGCAGAENSEAEIVVNGGTGDDYSYNWGGLTNETATASQLAPRTYFVTVTDENDCAAEGFIDITELAEIEANLISRTPNCYNTADGSIAISTVQGGIGEGDLDNYSFNWNTNDDTPLINDLVGDSIYQVTITDAQNCSTVIERFLDSPDTINLLFEVENVNCFEQNDGVIHILGTSTNETIATYQWSNPIATNDSATVRNLAAGNYQLTITTEDGCEVREDFIINQPALLAITNTVLTPNICQGDQQGSIRFEVQGGTADYRFNWSDGSDQSILTNIDQGNYTVTITDNNDCILSESFTVEGPEILSGSVEVQATTCFEDRDGRIELSATGGTPPYLYSLDGESYETNNIFIGLPAGAYNNHIQDANGCIWESGNIAVNSGRALLLDIIAEDTELELGDSTVLTAVAANSEGEAILNWSSNIVTTFECLEENCARILVKPQTSTKFEVYAIDEAGCEAETDLLLRLTNPKRVFVPSGFSPNNDGFNDILLIHGQSNIRVNYFQIFNRWGEEVFHARDFFVNDPSIFWDGSFRGEPLNGGVFTWIMEVAYLDQRTELFKGNTTLLK